MECFSKEEWKKYAKLLVSYSFYIHGEEFYLEHIKSLQEELNEMKNRLGGFDLETGERGYELTVDLKHWFWQGLAIGNAKRYSCNAIYERLATMDTGLSEVFPIINRAKSPLLFLADGVLPKIDGISMDVPYIVRKYIGPIKKHENDHIENIPF